MIDNGLILSDHQNITASAASDKYTSEGVVVNTGYPFIAEVRVTKDFAGSGTLTVAIEAGKAADFADVVVLGTSPAVPAANLKKGAAIQIPLAFNKTEDHTFIRANYTASADFTAGAVTTYLAPSVQTNMEG